MRPILLAGDWNASPLNSNPYRPRWLARHAGLRITTAGPGTFGDIDYALSDAHLQDVRRCARMGSDHQPVVMTVTWRDYLVMVGTWNLLAHRDPTEVGEEVDRLVWEVANLDVLLVQECSEAYAAAIRRHGLIVEGQGEQRVVVRPDVAHGHVRHHRLSTLGWPLIPGGQAWHKPATATSLRVAGWLRVVAVHLPNHERTRWHALAYRQAATRLARYVNRRRARAS